MNKRNYPGAKWWKFDFHAHTPASFTDFMKGCEQEDKDKITKEFWLQQFMEKGIDCVAVTDHNSGSWIDGLHKALSELKKNKPEWYRPLTLFPGVEISAHGGVHILAIFEKGKTQSDIDSLLGAVGYKGTNGVTAKTVTEVINHIESSGGIAIPAHVDEDKGLFNEHQGDTLQEALDNPNIPAMELCDSGYKKPQLYQDKKLQWTEVRGSDIHDFRNKNFGNFTWIKMDSPSIEGLKLALIDGKTSVNRDMEAKPNQHADFVIEEITVKHAKYIGRMPPLKCEFSPFLNTIIGGRGSGKSTLLEFMRFALRREKEIPKSIKDNKYFQVGGDNLLTDKSVLSLIYKKSETRYRLNWSADGSVNSLEVEDEGTWQVEDGEISSLFPVHIYSQKQIFELSKNQQALLDIIDKDPKVAYDDFAKQHKALSSQYKQTLQKLCELKEKIAEKSKLQGVLNDLNRQIEQIEKSGHKKVLQNYRTRQQQLNTIKNTEHDWREMAESFKNLAANIAPIDFNKQTFSEQPDILSALSNSNEKWTDISQQITVLVKKSQSIIDDWQQEKNLAQWMTELNNDVSKYEQLKTQLEQQGIDPEKYPMLLQQQALKQKELAQIKTYALEEERLISKQKEIFAEIKQNREQLTVNRVKFLNGVLNENHAVCIEIKPFAESAERVKKDIRRILCCDGRFDKDIDTLMEGYQGDNFNTLQEAVKKIYSGREPAKDKRFYDHLTGLTQESMIDLELWFPKDDLTITFGRDNQKIEQGSAGQKCAALLAFILSYGKEPLLLDQPEDDLDNELIYNLIVKQIRATKSKRQIIIVTHNANIVVNGDAEMVVPFSVVAGQTHINKAASIQDQQIREKICAILEGGQYAFSQRYKRIHLEGQ